MRSVRLPSMQRALAVLRPHMLTADVRGQSVVVEVDALSTDTPDAD